MGIHQQIIAEANPQITRESLELVQARLIDFREILTPRDRAIFDKAVMFGMGSEFIHDGKAMTLGFNDPAALPRLDRLEAQLHRIRTGIIESGSPLALKVSFERLSAQMGREATMLTRGSGITIQM